MKSSSCLKRENIWTQSEWPPLEQKSKSKWRIRRRVGNLQFSFLKRIISSRFSYFGHKLIRTQGCMMDTSL